MSFVWYFCHFVLIYHKPVSKVTVRQFATCGMYGNICFCLTVKFSLHVNLKSFISIVESLHETNINGVEYNMENCM